MFLVLLVGNKVHNNISNVGYINDVSKQTLVKLSNKLNDKFNIKVFDYTINKFGDLEACTSNDGVNVIITRINQIEL